MAKKEKDLDQQEGLSRLNRIAPQTDIIFNVIFFLISLLCTIPVLFVFMISITSEDVLQRYGYSFIPKEFSLEAYKFLFGEGGTILRALGVSVLVTVVGVIVGVILTTTMGYVLSRTGYKLNNFLTMVVFIPMIFNGGMIASYVVNTNMLGLKNSIWALIWPLAVTPFNIIICKTFFKTTIPDSVIESAKIDGAAQFSIFTKIVLPISKPVLATIGLFLTFGYWNDWFQSSLYINNDKLYSLQALLNSILQNIQVLAKNPAMGVTLQQYKNAMPQEGARMAIAIIIIIPIACAYPFFQKYFISGLTIGAVKG